ncbi:MAG: hypothetical protein KGM96_00630 [Acidobacteriota bacterium]|nr:hypothetical protein [Acidobacteriota bacterium]
MKFHSISFASLCLVLAGSTLCPNPTALAQQEAGQVHSPSKYLYVSNVELKPNLSSAFAKLESDEIQAMRAANAPTHYVGMWSITGASRVLFLRGFDSFADLQKGHDETMAMSKLEDTLKTDDVAEAPLIVKRLSSIYSYEKDLSLGAPIDLSKMRFMRILLFHVRSGHGQDFQHVLKLFIKAYQSSVPEARWAMFEKMYGVGSGNTYMLATPMESLSVVDAMHENGKKFRDSVGEDQLQMLRNSLSAAVESEDASLFAFGPGISYVPDSWISSSPDFWGKK